MSQEPGRDSDRVNEIPSQPKAEGNTTSRELAKETGEAKPPVSAPESSKHLGPLELTNPANSSHIESGRLDVRRMLEISRLLSQRPPDRDLDSRLEKQLSKLSGEFKLSFDKSLESSSLMSSLGNRAKIGNSDFLPNQESNNSILPAGQDANAGLGILKGIDLESLKKKEKADRPQIKLDQGRSLLPPEFAEFAGISGINAMIADLLARTGKSTGSDNRDHESTLSEEELESLQDARDQLEASKSIRDLISNCLYLAWIYQYLGYIDNARHAAGLALKVQPQNALALKILKELERVKSQDISFSPTIAASPELSRSSLAKCITSLSKGRIIVVGDLLIDELVEGSPERISREAPVLILEHVGTTLIPGGAANTAHNITALGGKCHAVGVCGEDEYKAKLSTMLAEHDITHDLVADPLRKTTVKTRILSKSHSLLQQLLRLDRISREEISEEIAARLIERLDSYAAEYDAIILSDYKAGTISDNLIEACLNIAAKHGTKVIVDAQNRFERFKGAALITPNQPDTEAFVGYRIEDQASLEKAGADMLDISGAEAVLITRGPHGMALFRKNHSLEQLPPFNKSEVFDVTGAGDTVVATMTLALVSGASHTEAMALGNLAAGIVVKKPGTAVTSQKEMLDTLAAIQF